MSEQGQKQPPEGKPVQSIILEMVVFAAVFLTIMWLVEGHSAIAAILGVAFIAYLIAKRKAG